MVFFVPRTNPSGGVRVSFRIAPHCRKHRYTNGASCVLFSCFPPRRDFYGRRTPPNLRNRIISYVLTPVPRVHTPLHGYCSVTVIGDTKPDGIFCTAFFFSQSVSRAREFFKEHSCLGVIRSLFKSSKGYLRKRFKNYSRGAFDFSNSDLPIRLSTLSYRTKTNKRKRCFRMLHFNIPLLNDHCSEIRSYGKYGGNGIFITITHLCRTDIGQVVR